MTERDRVEALHRLNLLESSPEERFDRITRAARELFSVPMAVVTLVDSGSTVVKSPPELHPTVVPREESFCSTAIAAPRILVVPDARADERFAGLPSVDGSMGIRFYAGRPLNAGPGMRVGTLCLYDTRPRDMSPEQLVQLEELGAWAEAELQDSADRDRARSVQQALMPAEGGNGRGYEAAGMFLPKSEVGGDFYSWRERENNLCLAIADAMGKGTAAALMAATVRSAILNAAGTDPGTTLDSASVLLARDLEATSTFATAFLATLDLETGTLRYADAGHGLSMIVSPDGTYTRLHGAGLPLGLGEPGSWMTHTAALQPGDTLATFTDGVLDLFDGSLASLDEIAALVATAQPAQSINVLRRLNGRAAPDDDLTALIVRRLGADATEPAKGNGS
ncbi:SpoIIE family protein phosphatase [Arthrobacter sp. AQ5-05]|uniref:PP2C family protein-serine/threonine phosphatase n=1 Tax=Arthrobacter sp. AQ5-05 TaxID=2184581 RepID=UPI0015ECD2BE|nr:SpoIIE family protein phosphatase [Arthrobacter sp. AQ5-05]